MSTRQERAYGAGAGANIMVGAVAAAAYLGFVATAFLTGAGTPAADAPARPPAAIADGLGDRPGPLDPAVDPDRVASVEGAATSFPARDADLAVGLGPVTPEGMMGDVLGAMPADAPLEFVVKFDSATAQPLIDIFVDDPQAARDRFDAMARANPAMRGLHLKRINLSGEATLAFEGAPPPNMEARDALTSDIVKRLETAPGVEYAEPNLTAWRGSTEGQ